MNCKNTFLEYIGMVQGIYKNREGPRQPTCCQLRCRHPVKRDWEGYLERSRVEPADQMPYGISTG